ncbi:MAG TPA: class I adenylate-forming enzyme family protein [Acidimicrobiia bacterium]
MLHERASARHDHPWLICDDEVLTYGEARARSAALAKGLLALGAGPGTRVGILHPNGAPFVVCALAATRIGAIAVPISTFSTSAELATLLRTADVEMLFATAKFRERDYVAAVNEAVPELDLGAAPPLYAPSAPALRRVWFDRTSADVAGARSTDALDAASQPVGDDLLAAAEARVSAADRMVVVHTSGSTSEPKGVVHEHGPLIRHLHNLTELRRYTAADVLFANSPFFWIGGFAYTLLGTLVAGATLVCSNATDPSATLDLIERVRPTMTNGFAAAVAHLAKDPTFAARDLSSIRRGNLWPIMPTAVRASDPELRHNMLGMTEAGSVCLASADEDDQPEHRRGSFGHPVTGFEARVVDPETGNDLAIGEAGELCLRGPFLMEGYLGQERHDTFTADGWYRTDDVFHRDAEGFFYFRGRRGDMIKTAGANVSPREVEAAIADIAGLVSHVVGIDDAERGQLVAAALRVPADTPAPDVDELQTALRAKLSAYKVPRRWLTLADADVPMLSSGKIDTRALKDRFRG